MSALLERVRDMALKAYLWGQRLRWPLPAAVRGAVGAVLARTIGRQIPERTDEWSGPFIPRVDNNGEACLGCISTTHRPADTLPARSLGWMFNPHRRDAHRQLRCVVAIGTLKLGGLEFVALSLARGLPLTGFDTVIAHAALMPSERPADSLGLNGVPVVKLSQGDVRQWLMTHRPDVISMHTPPEWLVAAAARVGIPTVETLHGSHNLFDRSSWPKERLRSRQVTGFVAVSELVRRQYLTANPEYPPDRVITIPNGVDRKGICDRDRTESRAWLGLHDEFLFVSLARYALQKNTFGLITAFSDVASRYPEARLLLAGDIIDPVYFEQLRRRRDRLPCAARVHLRGPCPDVSAVLAAADAFVLDSFFEGWSLASMEALCAGLPVVTSDVGGAREQVGEDGYRGFVVANPLGDPEVMDWRSMSRIMFSSQANHTALVEAMSAVISASDYWRDARRELQNEATTRFSMDVCLQRYADVLTRAAAGDRPFSPMACAA